MRGFVDEQESTCIECEEGGYLCPRCEARQSVITELCNKWNVLHSQIEQENFRSDEDRYGYEDYISQLIWDRAETLFEKRHPDVDASTAEGRALFEKCGDEVSAQIKREEQKKYREKEAIEQLLYQLGARMARPYEHWNEEEKLMEYLENRHDYMDM
jgi:hypothetical protein